MKKAASSQLNHPSNRKKKKTVFDPYVRLYLGYGRSDMSNLKAC
jgi:hypothetical protein